MAGIYNFKEIRKATMFQDQVRGSWSRPMVQLCGGCSFKPFGDKGGMKKLKMGPEWLNT